MSKKLVGRRQFLAAIGAGAMSLAIPRCVQGQDPAPRNRTAKRPNIVFVLVDDLGWMDVGANGSRFYDTPNVDRLAAEGMRFTQANIPIRKVPPLPRSAAPGGIKGLVSVAERI